MNIKDCKNFNCEHYSKFVDKNCMMKIEYIGKCKKHTSLTDSQEPSATSPAAMLGSMDWLANEITALIPLIKEDTFYDVLQAMETQGLEERQVIKLENTWNKFGQKNP